MNLRMIFAACAIAAFGSSMVTIDALGQKQSLKEQLVGTWTLLSWEQKKGAAPSSNVMGLPRGQTDANNPKRASDSLLMTTSLSVFAQNIPNSASGGAPFARTRQIVSSNPTTVNIRTGNRVSHSSFVRVNALETALMNTVIF